MNFSPLLDECIEILRRTLPGVGPKSAQRMMFHLLQSDRQKGLKLTQLLAKALQSIQHCEQCNNFTEERICEFCLSAKRDPHTLCVVESPADVLAIEQSASYRGQYFVLMGHLSPLDGIGPDDLAIPLFVERLQAGTIQEVIIATNPTVEGEATAHFLAELVKPHQIKVTRIAHGVPVGGELEFVDGSTLTRALAARQTI